MTRYGYSLACASLDLIGNSVANTRNIVAWAYLCGMCINGMARSSLVSVVAGASSLGLFLGPCSGIRHAALSRKACEVGRESLPVGVACLPVAGGWFDCAAQGFSCSFGGSRSLASWLRSGGWGWGFIRLPRRIDLLGHLLMEVMEVGIRVHPTMKGVRGCRVWSLVCQGESHRISCLRAVMQHSPCRWQYQRHGSCFIPCRDGVSGSQSGLIPST